MTNSIELWGGVECTVNRIRERFNDQTVLTGHQQRIEDLDSCLEVGFSAIRYPVLWERVIREAGDVPDWEWSDLRLARLRELQIRPILTLLHHGSGPKHTNLLKDSFALELAEYAGKVAERYPWVEDWTPVNEPLTTARFSCLYGHWYPHRRDEASLWAAMFNQIDGIRLAMREIRKITPSAKLIQTEDLGRTYASVPLSAQANFDNERRWLTWDMLVGRLNPDHALWQRVIDFGFEARAKAILDDPCPPDILGLNHYLTSDRYLDHELERYPPSLHGGNGAIRFADTEALRVLDPPSQGLSGALDELWQRYQTAIAVTEVHNGCTREEQLRWAAQAWDAVDAGVRKGLDIRAITAWSVFGGHGWNTLLTAKGCYESGLFDASAGPARWTALATLWQALSRGGSRHPVADEHGWWQRPERILYGKRSAGNYETIDSRPRLAIIGPGLKLSETINACTARGICFDVLTEYDVINMNGDADHANYEDLYWGEIDVRNDIYALERSNDMGISNKVIFLKISDKFARITRNSINAHLNNTLNSISIRQSNSYHYNNSSSIHILLDLLIDGVEGVWEI